MTDKPHSGDLRKHRRMVGPGTFFVTKNLQPRCPILCRRDTGVLPADVIVETLCHVVTQGGIQLAAFCVMPDHWHALLALVYGPGEEQQPPSEADDRLSLSREMRRVNSWIGRNTSVVLEQWSTIWQDGYHETRIRSTRQFKHVLSYIEHNPVNGGWCQIKEEWDWSSANETFRPFLTRPWPYVFENDVE